MRTRDTTWLQLVESGDFTFEAKAHICGKDYTAISAPRINRRVADKSFSVGNCNAASLKISIRTNDVIPPGAAVVIKGRLTDGAKTSPVCSQWRDFGTFFIESRDNKPVQGLISFTCYDAMLKVNQPFFASEIEESWPQTMTKVVGDIATLLGVQVDPRTQIKSGADYMVRYDSTLTAGQVLGYIGACHGGNWIITPENKLLLVPLFPTVTEDGPEEVEVLGVVGAFKTGQTVTVSGVSMSDTEDNSFAAGTTTGQVITISNNPYATQGICNSLYQMFNGKVYYPYTAQKAIYDPAAELGDAVNVKNKVHSVIYQENLTLDYAFRSDVLAPDSQEVTSEYPYQGSMDRMQLIRNEVKKRVDTSLKMGLADITATVEETQGKVAQLQLSLDGISLSVSEPFPDGNGQSYVSITLTVNGHTSTGLVKIDGNVDISGQLSAAALYAAKGDIARLTVDSLSTSRRIPLYLAGDTSDDDYLSISDQHINLVHAETTGASEQAKNPDGALLFWEDDITDATLGEDGYPYVGGSRVFTTTETTSWPVMVYIYEEWVKRRISFGGDENNTPLDEYGAGYDLPEDPDRGKGFIQKRTNSFDLWLRNREGKELGVFIGDRHTDIVGLRKPKELDFSGWDSGSFTEVLDDDGTIYTYQVIFDEEGRPVQITDSAGHNTLIKW